MGKIAEDVEKKVEKMEAQLAQWGAKVDELASRAAKAGADAKEDYRKRLEALKSKREAALRKLDALKGAGSDKWETFKVGVESALSDLATAFKDLTHTDKEARP